MTANTLPPLPEPIAFRTRPDATVKWWYGDSETKAPLCEIRERLFSAAQMNDHYLNGYTDALAAIAAQGVPDKTWEAIDEIEAVLKAAHSTMEVVSGMERKVGPIGSHARGHTHKITMALARVGWLRDMLASAPPAPQTKSDCSDCSNADSWGLPDKSLCATCTAGSAWSPLNKSSVNPNKTVPQASGYGPKLMPQVSGFAEIDALREKVSELRKLLADKENP